MILREIGETLRQQGRMSQRELARLHRVPETMLDAMLGVWMRKGRIRKVQQAGCSGKCCGQREEIIYEWLAEGQIGLVMSS